MAAQPQGLSDKALSIFAFAAYHRLLSGEQVTSVIRRDGKGHEADPQGVEEIEAKGLAEISDGTIAFTNEGAAFVESIVVAIRGATGR